MAYHGNLYILLFLPAAVILYSLVPVRGRRVILLLANILFYISFSRTLLAFLVGTALFTWLVGLAIGKKLAAPDAPLQGAGKKWLILGILGVIGTLGVMKYTNFTLANLNRVIEIISGSRPFIIRKMAVPLGISFYSMEAVSYLTDVYWKRIPAETNFFRMLLFLSFFPKIMEGPISRYEEVAPSLWECRRATMDEIEQGTIRILWGLFKKVVAADRLNTVVKTVFSDYQSYSGYVVVGISILYTIQLYLEFSGSIDIAIGSARMFGVKLMENFRQPFFAQNASEFWRRWHISLGVWFKNYIFYPITLSGPVKKWSRNTRKKYGRQAAKVGSSMMALLPLWLCNGLWHGPQWNYIFYGVYYFFFLSLENILEPVLEKIRKISLFVRYPKLLAALRIAKTWVIIFSGELFFRAKGFSDGMHMFLSIFRPYVSPFKDSVWTHLGITRSDWCAVFFVVVIVIIVDCFIEWKQQKGAELPFRHPLPRMVCACTLFVLVLVLGAYGAGYLPVDLIYAGF